MVVFQLSTWTQALNIHEKAQPAQNVFNFEVRESAVVSHRKHAHTLQQKAVRQDDGQSDTFVEALNNH